MTTPDPGHMKLSIAILAHKSRQIAAKDREWLADLPTGRWLTSTEAAEVWCVTRKEAWCRLDLLKAGGKIQRDGNRHQRRWMCNV